MSILSNYKSVEEDKKITDKKKGAEEHVVDYLIENGLDVYYPPGHTAPYDFLLKIND